MADLTAAHPDLTLHGHHYLGMALGARHALVEARGEALRLQREEKSDALVQSLITMLAEIVRDQATGTHGPSLLGCCTCGLIDGSGLGNLGHLDLETLQPAVQFLKATDMMLATRWDVVCVACDTDVPHHEKEEAVEALRAHSCTD